MTKKTQKKQGKIKIKVTAKNTFKIPETIVNLHNVDCFEMDIEDHKIVLRQVKEESEV